MNQVMYKNTPLRIGWTIPLKRKGSLTFFTFTKTDQSALLLQYKSIPV
jgi:hypothetical protein